MSSSRSALCVIVWCQWVRLQGIVLVLGISCLSDCPGLHCGSRESCADLWWHGSWRTLGSNKPSKLGMQWVTIQIPTDHAASQAQLSSTAYHTRLWHLRDLLAGASGLIDAVYILIDAHRQMATTMQEKPQNVSKLHPDHPALLCTADIQNPKLTVLQALSISGQYLEKFRASKNRRGEAAMLLSLAEPSPQSFEILDLLHQTFASIFCWFLLHP